jgi:hypothetical protein
MTPVNAFLTSSQLERAAVSETSPIIDANSLLILPFQWRWIRQSPSELAQAHLHRDLAIDRRTLQADQLRKRCLPVLYELVGEYRALVADVWDRNDLPERGAR